MSGQVLITGVGLITALGDGARVYQQRLARGERALGEAATVDLTGFHSTVVAEVSGRHRPPAGGSRRQALAAAALDEALADAGVDKLPSASLLVVVGQTPGSAATGSDPDLREFAGPSASELAAVHPQTDVAFLSHACASVGFGIAFGAYWLRARLGTMAAVVGASVLNVCEYASMDVVRVLSEAGARPFHPLRDGTTIGEGGGALILERAEDARPHEAPVTIRGVACLVGGGRRSAIAPEIAESCMRSALEEARVQRVDYVQAHGTGTIHGDEAELAALSSLARGRGWAEVPVASHKGAIGHLMHASMFPGIAAALGALRDDLLPGTPGLDTPRTVPGLRVLHRAERHRDCRTALVNAFGFGANSVSLVLAR